MRAEPEAVSRGDRFSLEVASDHSRFDRSDKERVDPFEDRFEQLAGIFPVFEKAVQHQAEARFEFGFVDTADEEITHHEGNHVDERLRRRLESSETLERRIAFAAQSQDL